ncbi:MAG: extracellular solute-binding protein [Clostridia bacterium]|nr:extracellular solute-binding protein [Clostridia bacterium]
MFASWERCSIIRRLTAVCCAAVMLISTVVISASADGSNAANGVSGAEALSGDGTRAPFLSEVLKENPYVLGKDTVVLSAADATAADGITLKADINGNTEKAIVSDAKTGDIQWKFTLNTDGWYIIKADYTILEASGSKAVRSLLIDGKVPCFEADTIPFYHLFEDNGEVRVNSIGDEVRPSVQVIECWQSQYLRDSGGYYTTPLIFPLKAGTHTLTLSYASQDVAISKLTVEPYKPVGTYDEVSATYPKSNTNEQLLTFQAEEAMKNRNDATIRLESDGDPETKPIAYGYRVFNTVGGYRWRQGNQAVTYEFKVKKSGLYRIAFRVKQSWNDGLPSYRTVEIDGKIPFAELESICFDYSTEWQTVTLGDEKGDYLFYLEEGTHTMTMTVTMGELTDILHTLYDDMTILSEMLLDITKLTGNKPDPNYDYQFFKFIPNLEGDMNRLIDDLQQQYDRIYAISGKSTSMGSNLISIIQQLKRMRDNPFSIAKKYSQLTQAQTNLGSWYLELQSQPLLIDEFSVATSDVKIPIRKSNFLQKLRSTIKNFLISFIKDYNNVGGMLDDETVITETIDVWIARGNEWAEIIKEMADESFTPKTGILVNVNVVPASQLNAGSANVLMLSMTSGTAPDVAMGVASGSPVEFAIRDAAVDLTQFADYKEVASRFIPQIITPFTYEGGVYAMPETMNFSCLFYRSDVIEKYGITLPNTRQELYDYTLPQLFENGLSYYQNADFTQFLYQYGGAYYSEDGYTSALDSPQAYLAFREYTEMFTHYSSPVSANFFNRFRTGEMPIGVGNYSLYIQLSTSAPELIGKWAIAPLPGIKQEDGTINRSCGGIAGECDMILKNDRDPKYKAGWEFLKWWSQENTQKDYAREMEALVGVEARWNTANVNAFMSLDWNRGDLEVIQEQWKWAQETPVVLGGYYTGRYVTNAFTDVVVAGILSPRDALENAVKEINRELRNKQDEYNVKANKK